MSIRISAKKLHGAHVRTRSGQSLGKVSDVAIDAETGRLLVLLVRAGIHIPGLHGDELQIAWSQIHSIDEKEVVVADAAVPHGAATIAKAIPQ